MKGLKILPRGAWIVSHTLFIVSLVLATIFLHSILPHGLARLASVAIWLFAAGLCYLFAPAFAKLTAKQ